MVNSLRSLFLISLFTFIWTLNDVEDEEKMIKKTKILACIAVTKARMAKDTV